MSKEDGNPAGHCVCCRFWHLLDDGDGGQCHRRAPGNGGGWPASYAWDWCGEHEPLVKQPKRPNRKGRT